jgi:adenosylmethionine-8-amino-7-oxononanoate aminotransferase
MAAAIDLEAPPAAPGAPRAGLRVCLCARDRGLILRPLGDTLLLVPPLCLSEDELDELVRRTAASIADALPR